MAIGRRYYHAWEVPDCQDCQHYDKSYYVAVWGNDGTGRGMCMAGQDREEYHSCTYKRARPDAGEVAP